MALVQGAGTNSVQLGTSGTKRDDISEMLAACLVLENNFAGSLPVGPEFMDTICQWDEDKLNSDFVTDTTVGGINTTATALNVSAADAAIAPQGTVLADISTTTGGMGSGEHIQVSANNGSVLTLTRAFAGTTAQTHAQGAVYTMVSRPERENSDLGPDLSHARIRKYNYLHRHSIDVVLSAEVIERSLRGYTPGIKDELKYQFRLRTQEILRLWNKTLIYSRGQQGTNGTASLSGGDFSTLWGARGWLDGGFNTTATPVNWATQGYASGDVFTAVNNANITLFRNGAVANWLMGGPLLAQDAGKLFSDRIRLQQDETTRGFAAQIIRTTLANELRILCDGYVQDGAGIGEIYVLDSSRWRLRPLAGQFYYTISAPTLRDGDQVRALSKMSLEARNTGSDVGAASILISNATL